MTPIGSSAGASIVRAARSQTHQERGAQHERERQQDAHAAGLEDEAHAVRDDDADEADEAAHRDDGGRADGGGDDDDQRARRTLMPRLEASTSPSASTSSTRACISTTIEATTTYGKTSATSCQLAVAIPPRMNE